MLATEEATGHWTDLTAEVHGGVQVSGDRMPQVARIDDGRGIVQWKGDVTVTLWSMSPAHMRRLAQTLTGLADQAEPAKVGVTHHAALCVDGEGKHECVCGMPEAVAP